MSLPQNYLQISFCGDKTHITEVNRMSNSIVKGQKMGDKESKVKVLDVIPYKNIKKWEKWTSGPN